MNLKLELILKLKMRFDFDFENGIWIWDWGEDVSRETCVGGSVTEWNGVNILTD